MARKDRVPNPPKRPQAPKRRTSPSAPRVGGGADRRLLYLLAGAAVLVIAAILAFVLLAGGDEDEAAALAEKGCTLTTYPGQPGTHVDSLTAESDPKWNSDPPTSGPHFVQAAIWGSYDEPVPVIQSVHNLEHGGIVVHYGEDVPQEQRTAIDEWYRDDPNGILVAPLEDLGSEIVLTAWTAPARVGGAADDGTGFMARCEAFDEGAFDLFKKNHRGEGPERFPVDALTPGS